MIFKAPCMAKIYDFLTAISPSLCVNRQFSVKSSTAELSTSATASFSSQAQTPPIHQ